MFGGYCWWLLFLLRLLGFCLCSPNPGSLAADGSLEFVAVRFEPQRNGIGAEFLALELSKKYDMVIVRELLDLGHPYYLYGTRNRSSIDDLLFQSVSDGGIKWVQYQAKQDRVVRSVWFNDPQFSEMYYLNNFEHGAKSKDMSIFRVWEQGYSGRGVVVSVVEDQFDQTHEEIRANYRPSASLDISGSNGHHRFVGGGQAGGGLLSDHGNQMAALVAGVANNSFCGVGVAYRAGIGAILLANRVVDADEARALSFGAVGHLIDIYLVARGVIDDGMAVAQPGVLSKRALRVGMLNGRGGRGSIYVWPSGNGGEAHDHCGADGFLNSVFTVTVGAVGNNMIQPKYGERCASMLTSAYASNSNAAYEFGFPTAGFAGKCRPATAGTSIPASIVAGVIALGLEANPKLCWRQVQYLLALASRKLDGMYSISFYQTWFVNGAGFDVSDAFGFGMLNAEVFVKMAEAFRNNDLPQVHSCSIRAPQIKAHTPQLIPAHKKVSFIYNSNICSTIRPINSLEHVELQITIRPKHSIPGKRGFLQFFLESPSSTKIPLLLQRSNDEDRTTGFINFKFMTTLFWFEPMEGDWIVTIENFDAYGQFELSELKLILRGIHTA